MRSFKFAVKWFWLPLRVAMGLVQPKNQILGGYFAGEIESVGKDVSKFKVGDQIYGSARLRFGAYGEYMCLPESYKQEKKIKSTVDRNYSFEHVAEAHRIVETEQRLGIIVISVGCNEKPSQQAASKIGGKIVS